MGRGQAVVRGAYQHGRELVGDGQDELQVGHGLFGPPPFRRQLILALFSGQLTAAEVTDHGLEISGDASVLRRVLPPPVAA